MNPITQYGNHMSFLLPPKGYIEYSSLEVHVCTECDSILPCPSKALTTSLTNIDRLYYLYNQIYFHLILFKHYLLTIKCSVLIYFFQFLVSLLLFLFYTSSIIIIFFLLDVKFLFMYFGFSIIISSIYHYLFLCFYFCFFYNFFIIIF